MQNRTVFRTSLAAACVAAFGLVGTDAIAQSHGGGHFGGHAVIHGGYGYRGGYGWHGGYGWRGGYYPGWGWGWGGLGLGLYFATLPLYYSTLWWNGVPYYYANDTYYVYDRNVGQYQTVAPPQGLVEQAAPGTPVGTDLIAYPKNGQSEEQQGKDKYECHHWAAGQTGFDPTQGAAAAATAAKRTDYMRAQEACLEGRGYTVK